MTEAFRIMQIPPALMVSMAPFVGPFLARGLQGAGKTPLEVVADVERDHNQIWAIFEGQTVVGAFITAIVIQDDDSKSLDIFGLCGVGAPRWGLALSDRMADYARANGCRRFVFDGKAGWQRATGNTVEIAGRKSARIVKFERRVG